MLKAVPVFVFRSIPRKSIDELFAHGHFEDTDDRAELV